MSRLEHRIRSLCWQVETGSSAEAFAWRSLLHARGTDLLLPVLEQGFDAAVPADEVVRIPRLNLHLRLNSPDELESVLLEAIPRQLREQLAGLRGQRSFSEEKRAEDERVQAVGGWHHLQSLLHYLQTGTLPWAAAVGSATDQLTALRAARARLWPQLMNHLRRQQEAGSFFFRLLDLIPEEDVGSAFGDLAGLFPGEESAAVFECLVSLREAGTGFRRYTRLSLMAALLAAMIGRDSRSTAISLSKRFGPSSRRVAATGARHRSLATPRRCLIGKDRAGRRGDQRRAAGARRRRAGPRSFRRRCAGRRRTFRNQSGAVCRQGAAARSVARGKRERRLWRWSRTGQRAGTGRKAVSAPDRPGRPGAASSLSQPFF